MTSSIIGSTMVIDGEVSGDEDVTIQGTVKGRVRARRAVVVEAGAVVEAEITARSLEISGHLIGNVIAEDFVDLKSSACVIGDISAPRINIAEGASFRGNVDMQKGPR